MNIFVVHPDPIVSAQMLNDKHVVKMILESAQILSTVNFKNNKKATYKPTHHNHPCTLWAGKTVDNYNWLKQHGIALCEEYTNRYKKIHKSMQYYFTEYNIPDTIKDIGLTEFVQAMPEQYRDINPVLAYRKYYIGEKSGFSKWTNREIPSWFEYRNIEMEM
jgi:hypothetical protein